ncbi:MAG TPA: hypothetical protein VIR38_09935, partial [Thalassobaculum sp.]
GAREAPPDLQAEPTAAAGHQGPPSGSLDQSVLPHRASSTIAARQAVLRCSDTIIDHPVRRVDLPARPEH